MNQGRVGFGRLRRALTGLPLPRAADGRLMPAVDMSNWLRPEAVTSPDRLFCPVYGRGKGQAQMIPGWPYSVVAALEPGRTLLDRGTGAVRLGPAHDQIAATAVQVRDVIIGLIGAVQWHPGDPDLLIIFDAGYDLARLLAGLPAQVLGRLRSDRVTQLPTPPRPPGTRGRPRKHGGEPTLADPATWLSSQIAFNPCSTIPAP